ncbi:hypothetical protein L207DRAFT_554320 [Hyaloscypha variabilis F]|uniref:Uncharacterized protein n=1 Tax=Hyaloscypha variabilis (strain UAMH 11265 / GT02V1 / F) TaxID=1149755 RepID=A0A2J6RQ30_HYAVF|nr:hypothetical protein L207DRAFT_554320 [Hyaloscypha variabilis F]
MHLLENDPLSTSLHQGTILAPLKFAILRSFWGDKIKLQTTVTTESQLEPYFNYYSQQCHLMLANGGRHVAARKHHDISDIIDLLNKEKTREEAVETIRSKFQHLKLRDENDMIQGSFNLAARLYLMMSLGEIPNAFTPERPLSWTSASVQDFLKQHLEPRPVLGSASIKLQEIFNARNVQRIAGIKIQWTSDLGQHLRLIHDDERLAIFHHASFLRLHRQSKVFPKGFIDETLRTLALLFPQSDKESVRLCGSLGAHGRHIEIFTYWHDRLVVVKQAFDEVEPGTLAHLWNDRRRPVQWYTLWTAVLVVLLTIFFGFVQCIEGAFQVYKAYNPD